MLVTSLLSPMVSEMFRKAAESELYASHLYQYMANQMQRLGYFGVQAFFKKESADELTHYQKLADFVNDMGGVLPVPSIEAINDTVNNIGDALGIAYETELSLMRDYQMFYEKAEDSKDCITSTFLIEFMQIQRKSVGEFGDLISRYNKNMSDVFEFDEYMKELANA